MCISALLAYMFMPCVCAWYPWNPGEGAGYPGTRVIDGCELPCGCWGLKPGLLQQATIALNCRAIFPAPVPILVDAQCISDLTIKGSFKLDSTVNHHQSFNWCEYGSISMSF